MSPASTPVPSTGGPNQAGQALAHTAIPNVKARQRRRQRRSIKCTFPPCGKYGHYTSQCWKAHPELRLQSLGPRYGQARTQQPLDTWSEVAAALPPPPPPPFRFLNLPPEIQNKIYQAVYAEKYGLEAIIVDNPEFHELKRKYRKLRDLTDEEYERVGGPC